MNRPIYSLRDGISKQFTTFDINTKEKVMEIPPGQTRCLVNDASTGIITRMWFTFPGWFWQHWNENAIIDSTILKLLILRIYWDGSDFPSVEAPMGDFFGIGHCEYKHYTSLYLGMSSGGFYCYFPMPFERGVRIEIENLHDKIIASIFMNINYQQTDSVLDEWGRFHCLFRCGHNTGGEPLDILHAKGRGHFVGCCLSIQGERMNYLSYLEAPEYIYIDDSADNPSIVGTGLEDYFNGGWYFRDGEFYGPLHGVPIKDVLRSMITMYRFHDQDAINFNKNIKMSFINPWDHERLIPFKFSSTAYWYHERASKLLFELPTKNQLVDMYRVRDTDHQSIP